MTLTLPHAITLTVGVRINLTFRSKASVHAALAAPMAGNRDKGLETSHSKGQDAVRDAGRVQDLDQG